MANSSDKPILISRYSSRRLYNTAESEYITLDKVANLIREGKKIEIIDNKSGNNITRQILLQIITEHESRGKNVLPLNVLMDIVRSYDEQSMNIIPEFLSQSFDALKNQQDEIIGSVKKQLGDPLQNMKDFNQTQTEILDSLIKPWIDASNPDKTAKHQEKEQDVEPAQTTDRDEQILQMKQQIEQMQNQLKNL